MRKIIIGILVTLVLVLFLPACAGEEAAVTPEKFYKGASVTFVTGARGGENVDVLTRLFEPYFEEITGANAIVEARLGGGGIECPNTVYVAEPDGLTIGAHMGGVLAGNWLLDEPAATYDPTKFTYLGAILGTPSILLVKDGGPYDSAKDLQAAKDLIVAGGTPRGAMAITGMLQAHLLGLDFKLVTGFKGPPAAKLAVLQGEADMFAMPCDQAKLNPELKPVVLLSLKRHNFVPDVPAISEVVDLTPEGEGMVRLMQSSSDLGMSFFLPPGVPQDRVNYLRDVFSEITARNDFISQVEEKLLGYTVTGAEELEPTIKYLAEHKPDYKGIMALLEKYAQ